VARSALRSGLRQAGVLARIASRNLLAGRAKTLIVGGIILFGTALVVVGSSLVDGVDAGMRRSIQGSLGGDVQVYDSRSKDDLALYGGAMGEPDLHPIEDFAKLARTLRSVPNVKAVVPMAIDVATVALGSPFDMALERLRADVRRCMGERDSGGCSISLGLAGSYGAHLAQVRRMVDLIAEDLSQTRRVAAEGAADPAGRARRSSDLARARSQAFWAGFDQDPLGSLEFLENRIAPLSVGGGSLPLRYVATDLGAFARAFHGLEVVEGTPVPPGARGILLGKRYAEETAKERIRVGDVITLEAPARTGYAASVNVKVYGLVQFKGLERSDLAGLMSLVDLATWRHLYGYPTPEQAAEIDEIKAAAGVRDVPRGRAEAELFGEGAGDLVERGRAAPLGGHLPDGPARRRGGAALGEVYTQSEIDGGVVKNAAVLLVDDRRTPETIRAIDAACRREGLPIRAVSWLEASGTVGQFVTLARVVLYGAVFILFAVALVVINNATVMATLNRVKEIGTMRAMGAQRRFVLLMVLLETMAAGLVFGVGGAALGSGIVWLIGAAGGIPATNGDLYFFYSGPSLLPRLGAASLGGALVIVLGVSALSALYPALLATRVAPAVAMQTDD
jgi:ABC-type lipoprotein release transport system permease subunit